MSGNVTIAVDDVDAEDRENLTRFFRDVVDMTKGRAITYADMLVKKGIGSPEKLRKRVLKNERYLVDAGVNEEDAEEILEALKREDLAEVLAQPPKIRRNTSAESQNQNLLQSQSNSNKETGSSVKNHVLDIQKFTEVLGVLGRGGMGVAYHCIYAESQVAVKAVMDCFILFISPC